MSETEAGPVVSPAGAIVRAQLRSMRNAFSHALRADPVRAALGTILAVSTALVSVAMGVGALVACAVVEEPVSIRGWFVAGLLGVSAFLLLIEGVVDQEGASGDLVLLQLFPISRARLLRLDLLSAALTPTGLFVLPSTAGVAVGAAFGHVVHGRVLSAAAALVAVPTAYLTAVALARAAFGAVAIGGRRAREVALLCIVALLMIAGGSSIVIEERVATGTGAGIPILSLVQATFPGAAARLASGTSGLATLFDLSVLGAWAVVALWAQRRVTGRILDGETGGGTRAMRARPRRAGRWLERVSDPVLGVAVADLRTLARIPALWALMFVPVVLGMVLGRVGPVDSRWMEWRLPAAALSAHLLFYSPLIANLFGADHAAVAALVLAPVSPARWLIGKLLARIPIGVAQLALFLAALSFRSGGASPREIALAAAGWLAVWCWIASGGVLLSVRLPYRIAHGVQKKTSARSIVAGLSQLVLGVLILPPAATILGGRFLRGTGGQLAGTLLAFAGGAVLLYVALEIASRWLEARAPELVDELTRG